jgi:multiple sugar transport system substrate-binding protein
MAPGDNSLDGRVPAGRRSFFKGLGAAGVTLSGVAMPQRWSFADDAAAIYTTAAIDWKQVAGETITLAGAIHPWSKAIAPLLPEFTKLTHISVVTDFQLETMFLGALPIKLASGSVTPDVLCSLPTAKASRRDGWSR